MRENTLIYAYETACTRRSNISNRKLLRQIQIRNQILFLLLVTIVILFLSFFFIGFFSQASDENRATYKYYKSIEITSGDTLWGIAEAYKGDYQCTTASYVNEIKTLNHIKSNTIKKGQYIIVPYYSSDFK